MLNKKNLLIIIVIFVLFYIILNYLPYTKSIPFVFKFGISLLSGLITSIIVKFIEKIVKVIINNLCQCRIKIINYSKLLQNGSIKENDTVSFCNSEAIIVEFDRLNLINETTIQGSNCKKRIVKENFLKIRFECSYPDNLEVILNNKNLAIEKSIIDLHCEIKENKVICRIPICGFLLVIKKKDFERKRYREFIKGILENLKAIYKLKTFPVLSSNKLLIGVLLKFKCKNKEKLIRLKWVANLR